MTLEEFIRGEAQGRWSLEVYGIAPGYLKVRISPDRGEGLAIEYWLVGDILLDVPLEEKVSTFLAEAEAIIAAEEESIDVEAIAA